MISCDEQPLLDVSSPVRNNTALPGGMQAKAHQEHSADPKFSASERNDLLTVVEDDNESVCSELESLPEAEEDLFMTFSTV